MWRRSIAAVAAGFMGAAITACGGASNNSNVSEVSSPALNGIALTGKALDGAFVAVMDSTGKQCSTTTDANGKWSVLLQNCGTAPFLIVASKNGDIFYSAATAADVSANVTVNVSQLTDAIVKVALNNDAPTASDISLLTDAALQDSNDVIMNNLVPPDVIADAQVNVTINIRTARVEANSHAGLDKLHDRIPKIDVPSTESGIGLLATITKQGKPSESTIKAIQTNKSPAGKITASLKDAPPVTSSFNLRKAWTDYNYQTRASMYATVNGVINGQSYSGSISSSNCNVSDASKIFEGKTALQRTTTTKSSVTLLIGKQNKSNSGTSIGITYYDENHVEIGRTGASGYTVYDYPAVPDYVKVGDGGIFVTGTTYSNSSKTSILNKTTTSYKVEDYFGSALVTFESIEVDANGKEEKNRSINKYAISNDEKYNSSLSLIKAIIFSISGTDTMTASFKSISSGVGGDCGGGSGGSAQVAKPSITAPPASQGVAVGSAATFTVAATGDGTLAYQWKKNGTDISGATSSIYTTPATANADNGTKYSVVVTNSLGTVTSNDATLTVSDTPKAPAITIQPDSQSVVIGETATFKVVATGSALTYQWKKNGTVISGATSSTYTTPATSMADSGAVFTVVVSNALGSDTSSEATLTVTAAGVIDPRFSLVANASGGTYDKTECVKDNSTGLVWEGKNPSGSSTRASDTRYTNYDDTSSAQKWNGSAYVNPTQTEIDASTNSIGYKNSVNTSALCGYTDWRMPTKEELQGILASSGSPRIDTTWFPNTPATWYWSSSPLVGYSGYACFVAFANGNDSYDNRDGNSTVRLVRASQ